MMGRAKLHISIMGALFSSQELIALQKTHPIGQEERSERSSYYPT